MALDHVEVRLSHARIHAKDCEDCKTEKGLLDEIQSELLEAARARRDAATFRVDSYDELKEKLADPGGFLKAHWCGDGKCEERIQEETKATIRCLAFDEPDEAGRCIICDGASQKRAHFAKAY